MEFIYGKQDFSGMERGQENCYLLTNGLGGYSSLTMIGSCARNDHALFMAAKTAPTERYHMISKIEECIKTESREYRLSSQEYVNSTKNETGYQYLDCFYKDNFPVWLYRAAGIEIKKSLVMKQGENTIGIHYHVVNEKKDEALLTATPWMQFAKKGELPEEKQKFTVTKDRISSKGLTLFYQTNGTMQTFADKWQMDYYYAYDARDGRDAVGRAAASHEIVFRIAPNSENDFYLVYSMEPYSERITEWSGLEAMFQKEAYRQEQLVKSAGIHNPVGKQLVKSGDCFFSERESTGEKTIMAGYPFFGDWGRDTMLAVSGIGIASGRYDDVKSIFRSFVRYCKKGIMPNMFPESGEKPLYNTVDASLLFIMAVYEYYEKTKDIAFVAEVWKTVEEILEWYQKGTDYHIKMEEDGLLCAGAELEQVTWMDIRYEDILPTPRHGKPVEINAWWYNAIKAAEKMAEILKKEKINSADTELTGTELPSIEPPSTEPSDIELPSVKLPNIELSDTKKSTGINPSDAKLLNISLSDIDSAAAHYRELAQKVKKSFQEQFWNEKAECLKDTVSGNFADLQIRCNQIWAVSAPFSVLNQEQEARVLKTVYKHLYTPYGLRTLSPDDKEFKPFYGGSLYKRDMAYHQGTVWPFPLGAYYLAYLKVNQYSGPAKERVYRQLKPMEACLREGCIGQIAEIYDGLTPKNSKGCFAQAWSVGEILRVYAELERV